MEKTVFVSCPLDCFDLCRFKVGVKDNQVIDIQGDPDHPVTRGFICQKGKRLKNRYEQPDRLLFPLVRSALLGRPGNGFEKASWDQVLDLISSKLISIKSAYGPTAVIDYLGAGYGGLKGRIQSIFFNAFGGATRPVGSLCWGAGIAAQKYDFGSHKSHAPDDILNSKLILLWGKNPKYTSLHLYTLLKQAEKQGSKIIVIDPIQTATAKSFDSYIRIKPSTDGALALAMAKVIIDHDLHDNAFIQKHVKGFRRFKSSIQPYTLEYAQDITGLPAKLIESLALDYAAADCASIYLGLGLQRYENGGNTIRAIDALAAIAGKIGKKGCGVNYAAKSAAPYLDSLEVSSMTPACSIREFSISQLADFLDVADKPPVKAIFVAGTNPLNQGPDIQKTIDQFSKIEFKVVFDHFMTDTARYADIVLPAASVFEQEDIFATSMYSPVVNYSHQAVEPPDGIIPEFDFYLKLAQIMGINTLGFSDTSSFLEKSASPFLEKLNMDFETFKNGYPSIKEDEIAWADLNFKTESGRIEIYSSAALKEIGSAMPVFMENQNIPDEYPLRLLTCHTIESMHSQDFAFVDKEPVVSVNAQTAFRFSVKDGAQVRVKNEKAALKGLLAVDDSICNNAVFIYQGFWHKSGSVNFLTHDKISDMGFQAAYYDTFCTIENIETGQ